MNIRIYVPVKVFAKDIDKYLAMIEEDTNTVIVLVEIKDDVEYPIAVMTHPNH